MTHALRYLVAVAALAACSGGSGVGHQDGDLPAPTGIERPAAVLLRLPVEGGAPSYYAAGTLEPLEGLSAPEVPPLREAWGIDHRGLLIGTTPEGGGVAIDLASGRVVDLGDGAAHGAVTATETAFVVTDDGHVVSVDGGEATEWRATLPGVPEVLAGRRDNRLVALKSGDSAWFTVAAADEPPVVTPLPPGPVAVTLYGELVAAADEGGVTLYDPAETSDAARVRLAVPPTALAFSPSGHRLFAAHDAAGIAVIDRYAARERDGLPLPGGTSDLRVDPMGHWLLTPAGTDSVWIVDAVRRLFVGAVAARWTSRFPLVTPDGVLLVVRGDSLTAYDPGTLERLATRTLGNAHWLATTYFPEHAPDIAAAPQAAEQTSVSGVEVFVQVASSQNPTWASALADDLTRDAGLPARVLEPEMLGEGYRVVIGPYATRAEADAVARKLQGRPHWIFTRQRGDRNR